MTRTFVPFEAPFVATVRDRILQGVIVIAFGLLPIGFTLGLLVMSMGSLKATLWGFAIGLPLVLLGGSWLTRNVAFAPSEVSVRGLVPNVTIPVAELTSVRIVRSAHFVVRGASGKHIRVDITGPAAANAAAQWLEGAAPMLVRAVQARLAAGEAIDCGRRARLSASTLQRGKTCIDLTKPFALEELPPGPHGSALLRVAGQGGELDVDGDVENYCALKRHLQALRDGVGRRSPAS